MRREQLINDLSADLKPVRSPGRTRARAAIWLVIATVYSTIVILASGRLRDGALVNLLEYPWFAVETIVAGSAVLALTIAALRLSIPSPRNPLLRTLPALVIAALWIGFYVVGFWQPAHPVSTLGVRDHCVLQGLFFSFPSMALLLYYARGLMPLWPRATGALAGAAAGAIPAAWMQLACMYIPSHILTHHMATVVLLAVIGALVGPVALQRSHTVPRNRGRPIH